MQKSFQQRICMRWASGTESTGEAGNAGDLHEAPLRPLRSQAYLGDEHEVSLI